ncbi:SIR2-like protein [Nitrosomonas nitrosa]|uniref:SIR2-like domain-containing protein n=1 Tax=Nitrosomonas nitrosa TaxID=52442 RepID=A0A1I4TN24_9PROT|nr:SIR2 family protein [Nitrosomonas nitrosa]PTQ92602.1 SIR2-like protein [Nitrosomonas nitrosa]SFM77937.1 SIR2-like domain-containing protein [Nitrosomonas nitrosa]
MSKSKASIIRKIRTVKTLNRQQRLVLFVGAGISIGCGLPSWDALTQAVVKRIWKKDQISVGLINGHSNIQAARYARKKAGIEFNQVVRDCLYNSEYCISNTVHAIAKSGISNICTFNFDDLIEDAFLQNAIEPNVAILGQAFKASYDEPTILHPHGLLERNASKNELTNLKIIFSEDDYNALYSDPYSWANLAQLSLLISHSALFIGISLTDPNLRRLIDVSRKNGFNNQHFAVFRNPLSGASKKEKPYFRKVRYMRELDLMELGITPWFVDDYENIEEILDEISIPFA